MGGMKKRKLIRDLIRRTIRPDRKQDDISPAMRLINRIAAVVYPTNNSGNNMSVR